MFLLDDGMLYLQDPLDGGMCATMRPDGKRSAALGGSHRRLLGGKPVAPHTRSHKVFLLGEGMLYLHDLPGGGAAPSCAQSAGAAQRSEAASAVCWEGNIRHPAVEFYVALLCLWTWCAVADVAQAL